MPATVDRLRVARKDGPPADAEAGALSCLPHELLISTLSCRSLEVRDIVAIRASCFSLYATSHQDGFVPVMIEAHLRGRESLRATAVSHGPDQLKILAFVMNFPKCEACGGWSCMLKLTEGGCCAHCDREGHSAEVRLIRPRGR